MYTYDTVGFIGLRGQHLGFSHCSLLEKLQSPIVVEVRKVIQILEQCWLCYFFHCMTTQETQQILPHILRKAAANILSFQNQKKKKKTHL